MSNKLLDSPTEEVVAVVNRDGLKTVAKLHRISYHKLRRWIVKQGYASKQLYVRAEPTKEVTA